LLGRERFSRKTGEGGVSQNLQRLRFGSCSCSSGLTPGRKDSFATNAIGVSLSSDEPVGKSQGVSDLVTGCHGGDLFPEILSFVVLEEARTSLAQVIIDGSRDTGLVPLSQRLLIFLPVAFDDGSKAARTAMVDASLALATQDI